MFFSWKQLILTAAGIVVAAVYFMLPENKEWINKRVFGYGRDFVHQKNNLDLEYRKIKRYDNAYVNSTLIASFFKKKGIDQNVLVIVPSTNYFKRYGIDYEVPEPAVFYYYTGLKTIEPFREDAKNANCFVALKNQQLFVDSFRSDVERRDSIHRFNQLK